MSQEEITQEEIKSVLVAKYNAQVADLEAQKSVALSKLAESNAENLILKIYNKYNLTIGVDKVLDNGKIVRGNPVSEAKKETATNG